MPEIVEALAEFAGIGVKYDPDKNPFFEKIMLENLQKIKSVKVGESLLASIAAATPASRGDFKPSINVLCVPTHINFTQSGFKRDVVYGDGGSQSIVGMTATEDARFAPPGCPFWIAGACANEAVDQGAANNSGSVCIVRFSNAQVITNKGETALPFVVLAHELIHSLHCLEGKKIDSQDEELSTTGLGKFADDPMTENKFRLAFGLPIRTQYY